MENVNITLKGRIDSTNAPATEQEVMAKIKDAQGAPVVIDMEDLEYISSAGLRVLLKVKKTNPDLKIVNVSSEVYEILEMTGFTEMMTVEKAYKTVSVEGCEVVGIGANGTVYRIDQDTVVKAYNNADALEDIQHEREVARLALILGLPTAISYDVVKVGDSYASVFELLNARSFTKLIIAEPERLDWIAGEFIKLLKQIHSTVVPEGKLPSMKEKVLNTAEFMRDYMPQDKYEKLVSLVKAVPESDHMIHGDYHTKNVMLQGDEVLLIDMDTLATGNPIFELAYMYNAFQGYSEYDHDQIMRFQGYDFETGTKFWHKVMSLYLGTESEEKIREVEDKARILGYTRMIRGSIKRGGLDDPRTKEEIDMWMGELNDLLDKTDSLLFTVDEIEVEAVVDNLKEVQAFIDEHLEAVDCPMKASMQISLAAEEIFVNIANYAYAPDKGNATVRIEVTKEPAVIITFVDQGVPYDPLAKEDPDVSLSAEARKIGGLGIFLTKKTMDDVVYEYKDGSNILRMKKII
ncbi:MAG: anti-sigma factor antagonist [Clostridiales bacterium]|nr:anti-sigma factor antagonist [Clostridiales bacterium]